MGWAAICPPACMTFIWVAPGKIFLYSVSDCLLAPHTNLTELYNQFIFSEDVTWKGILSATPSTIAKWEMKTYIPLLSAGFSSPWPCGQWKSKVWGRRAAWLLWPDKHNRYFGLITTHAHPCSCPSSGCWNSLAKGKQGYFSTYALSNCTPMQSSHEQQDC